MLRATWLRLGGPPRRSFKPPRWQLCGSNRIPTSLLRAARRQSHGFYLGTNVSARLNLQQSRDTKRISLDTRRRANTFVGELVPMTRYFAMRPLS